MNNKTLVKKRKKIVLFTLVVGMFILLNTCSIFAQSKANLDFLDNGDLEKFINRYIEDKRDEHKIPGVAVSVVENSDIVFLQGYGLADIENNVAIDPEKTLFRMASLAKLFTVIGTLQLVDSGEINLDDDVNMYLGDIKIKNTFEEPITIRHLLTHTEGLEAHMINTKTLKEAQINSLKDFLSVYMAKRIMKPGRMITYGNYATAVLGLVIENQSGQSFHDYMKDQIFRPLNMENSSFEQPLPEKLFKNRAGEYRYDSGEYIELEGSYSDMVSSGGFHSTPKDISKFMAAFLSNDDAGILEPSTKEKMFTQQFTGHPEMPGITFGLFEYFENGQRLLIRDGDSEGFQTRVIFLPKYKIGLFITYNTNEGALREEIVTDFLDEFFPEPETKNLSSISGFTDRAKGLGGYYNFVQYSHTTFSKIITLFTPIKVTINENKRTLTTKPMMEEPFGNLDQELEFVEISPGLFRAVDQEMYIAFKKISDETYLFSGSGYHGSFQKLTWYKNPILHQSLFVIFILLFLGLLVYSFKKEIRKSGNSRQMSLLKQIGRVVVTLNLVFILALIPVIMLIGMTPGLPAFVKGINLLMKIEFTLPIIGVLLVLIMVFILVINWKERIIGRWFNISIAVLSVFYYLFLNYWNLFGYQFTP